MASEHVGITTTPKDADEPRQRGLALSAFDLQGGEHLMVSGCEDCACPVNEAQRPRVLHQLHTEVLADSNRWIVGENVVEIILDEDHWVLFNPLSQGGIVVVNDLGLEIFRRFRRPCTLTEAEKVPPYGIVGYEQVVRSLVKLGLIHHADRPLRPQFHGQGVMTAWLHVTNACNLRCPYCYLTKTDEAMDEDVGLATIDAVMRSASLHGFRVMKLKYAGGEAALNHRTILVLHTHAQSLASKYGIQLQAVLLSNGVNIPLELVELLKAEDIRLMISVDGVGHLHDVQRPSRGGKPTFRLVERTISRLIERGHPPHLSITITNRNLEGLPDVVRFALEKNLTSV